MKYRIAGIFSWAKTFAKFAVSGQFAKVLAHEKLIFIEYGGVIINGHVIVISHTSRKFLIAKIRLSAIRESFHRGKCSCYTVV